MIMLTKELNFFESQSLLFRQYYRASMYPSVSEWLSFCLHVGGASFFSKETDWLQENMPDEDRTIPMRENTYVRVYGNVRSFNNLRSVVAFKIAPITDMNELTTHLLEVVHSHLYWTKGQAQVGVSPCAWFSTVLNGSSIFSFILSDRQIEFIVHYRRGSTAFHITLYPNQSHVTSSFCHGTIMRFPPAGCSSERRCTTWLHCSWRYRWLCGCTGWTYVRVNGTSETGRDVGQICLVPSFRWTCTWHFVWNLSRNLSIFTGVVPVCSESYTLRAICKYLSSTTFSLLHFLTVGITYLKS